MKDYPKNRRYQLTNKKERIQMKSISKSRFVSGIQCSKKIYFDYFRKDLKLPVNAATQQVFDLGHAVGALAQNCFPHGKDATSEDFSDFSTSIAQTKHWIAEETETITKPPLPRKIPWSCSIFCTIKTTSFGQSKSKAARL